MAGLNLGMNAVLSGGSAPSYGSVKQPSSVSEAAFGSGGTQSAPTDSSALKPVHGFGVAVWTGVIAIGLLVLVRKSLPN
jgi:hypothetical protein